MEGLTSTGSFDRVLDCYGLLCPVPVRKTATVLKELEAGQVLKIIATDEWFGPDLEAWLRTNPHRLLVVHQQGEEFHAYVEKRS